MTNTPIQIDASVLIILKRQNCETKEGFKRHTALLARVHNDPKMAEKIMKTG